MGAHDQVRVPEAAGCRTVGADAADLAGEMEHDLWCGVAEQPLGVFPARQVVVGTAGAEDLVPLGLETLDEVRAEKTPAARDEVLHAGVRVGVRATPSSHETRGSHSVSRFSFS